MPGLMTTTRKFITDLAQDAVHFPNTTESWPQLKQAALEFYTETKNDLFFFRKTTAYPLISTANTEILKAESAENTTLRTESLLALKQDSDGQLTELIAAQNKKAMKAALTTAVVGILSLAGGPVTAGIFFALGIAATAKYASNEGFAGKARYTINDKIDRDILALAASEKGGEVFASPAFQKTLLDKGVLKKAFTGANWGHSKEKDYTALVAQTPVAKTQAPAA